MQVKEGLIARRKITAEILMTFALAGADIFCEGLDFDAESSWFVASCAARRSTPNNPFGSTRFYGVFFNKGVAYLVFYADESPIYYDKEMTLFNNLTDHPAVKERRIIIMGSIFVEMLRCVLWQG